MNTESNYILELAARCINQTNMPLFLTGKAGTGKTTFLRHIVQHTHKNTIVVAPTGVAAINAGGVTIHSLFQLPFGLFLPVNSTSAEFNPHVKINNRNSIIKHLQMHERKRRLIRELELLIIDEVSMLRADVLDSIDTVLRYVRRKNNVPFGGVQVLFIGDLLQLPPVVKDDEWSLMKEHYDSFYFFDAVVLKQQKPIYIELQTIYRQSDKHFISLLNNLRNNEITQDDVDLLNEYYQPDYIREENDNVITLTTHNYKADTINKNELERLEDDVHSYEALIDGEFSEYGYPLEKILELKIGAQVMFIKNDISEDRLFFNGKIGTVVELSKGNIKVQFNDTQQIIDVEKYVWKNIRYTLNETTNEIEEKTIGTFTHYPIKLAWAITVHKSQGLTFDKAVLDINDAFASGQTYVALSRLRSLNGLILTAPINFNRQKTAVTVIEYAENNSKSEEVIETRIEGEKINYLETFLLESFDFKGLYFEIKAHVESYTKDENKSDKQKHFLWAKKLQEEFIPIYNHGATFSGQLTSLFQNQNIENLLFIEERVHKATGFFSGKLKEISGRITQHIKDIQSDKKIKIYQGELYNLDNAAFKQLQTVTKASAIITAVLNNTEFSKQTSGITALQQERFDHNKQFVDIVGEQKNKRSSKKSNTDGSKEIKINTKEQSYILYKEGKSIDEIAEERNMNTTTIEGHLAHYVALGEINIDTFVPEEKIHQIIAVVKTLEQPLFGLIKQRLGDEYTYAEIRFAMSHFNYLESKKK